MNARNSDYDTTSGEATIRMKLPWHYILGLVVGLAAVLIVMWAGQQRLTEKVGELEVAVRTGNALMITLQKDIDLTKWRIETIERRAEAAGASRNNR